MKEAAIRYHKQGYRLPSLDRHSKLNFHHWKKGLSSHWNKECGPKLHVPKLILLKQQQQMGEMGAAAWSREKYGYISYNNVEVICTPPPHTHHS